MLCNEYSNKFIGSKEICSVFNTLIGAVISENPTPINVRPAVINKKAKMLNNRFFALYLGVLGCSLELKRAGR